MSMSMVPMDLGTASNISANPDITPAFISLHDSDMDHTATLITPPSSTIRKNKNLKQQLQQSANKEPLSPTKSSPTPPTKARRNRSDGCSRVNGSLSLDYIIKSLMTRKQCGKFNDKPPYSYAILICLAILQSHEGKLTLSQIYHWISSHFPFFQLKDSSWQNSIRHNLSLNEGFIKTMKSSDGKGHFWQVKESSAQKFFKHESRSYDEIRATLKDLDYYFFHDSNESIDPHDSNTLIESSSLNNIIPISVSKPHQHNNNNDNLYNDKHMNFNEFDNGDDEDDDDDESLNEDSTPLIQISSPPIFNADKIENESSPNKNVPHFFQLSNMITLPTVKRSQTTLGFQPYENKNSLLRTPVIQNSNTFGGDFPHIQDMFPNQSMFNSTNNHSTSLLSPRNYKKYICSFNSNFEMSPNRKDTASSMVVDNDESELHVNDGSFNVKYNYNQISSNSSNDLLKTPELRRSHSLEATPIQLLRTPRDKLWHDINTSNKDAHQTGTNNNADMLMKNWKTPCHLFEDIYSSPIMKAMGKTPITKVSSTPNGTVIKSFSPRKSSAPDISNANTTTTIKTKLSSGGLFGVDVYSVWERALKDIDCSKPKRTTDSMSSGSKNEKLDLPFVSKSQESKFPKDNF
ncbi:forkhead transcription factor Hcm1p [Monosporozyma servazzii]